MRLTAHLGFSPPDRRMQFLSTLGTTDPVAHVRHAAQIGMAGVLYPWAIDRPPAEVADVRRALFETGLACSALVSIPSAEPDRNLWSVRSPGGAVRLEAHMLTAARLANFLGSTVLAAIVEHELGAQAGEREAEAVAANLADAARIAADHGTRLAVEPMIRLPTSVCRSTAAGLALIRRADHPALGLIYDTAHSEMMDDDILQALQAAYEHIVLIQLGDQPGRREPGAGDLPLADVVLAAMARGYSGLIDLEHHWLDSSVEGERQGLERIRAFEAEVAQRMAEQGLLPA